MKHLVSTPDLSTAEIISLLRVADHMQEINSRPQPKVPALRGRTVATLFFEDSTRTRLSFETAAKRLSADTMTFSVSSSSVNKGETIRDTIETLSSMGVDAFVVRHKSSGVPASITRWTQASVVNAGDGWHQHPTQALLDAFTITRELDVDAADPTPLKGRNVAIVGDAKHSRVARSTTDVLGRLGANVMLVAPGSLLPPEPATWGIEVVDSLDAVLPTTDVLYMLRVQRERMDSAHIPSVEDYCTGYALTPERVELLPPGALVMHPGPMNRGVEMRVDPSEVAGSRILHQVANGVAVRMAVLFTLLASPQSQGDDVLLAQTGGQS